MGEFKFIHIGHHKCGSTFIQWEVLPRIAALRPLLYELHHLPGRRQNYEQLMYLIHCADICYDPAFLDPLRQVAADCNCLSFEGLVGHGTMEGPTCMSVRPTALRLREVFGPTTIFFVIRNQRTWLPSWYRDDVQFGLVCDFSRWLFWRRDFHHLNWGRYAPVIACYREVFGAERVRVVLFEDLFRHETFAGIFDACGVDPAGLENVNFRAGHNVSPSGVALALTRGVNRHFGTKLSQGDGSVYHAWREKGAPALDRWLGRLAPGLARRKQQYPGLEQVLREIYHEDNLRTSELIGVDLAERGYP